MTQDPPSESEGEVAPPAEEAEPSGGPGGEVVALDFGGRRAGPRMAVDDSSVPPAHRAAFEAFARMVDESMVLVTLDARVDGVSVPPTLAEEFQLGLNFSHRFGIDDFSYDAQGVRASLSFGGDSFFCEVPWAAVWMMRSHNSGELALVADHVPTELREALEAHAAQLREMGEVPDEAEAEAELARLREAAVDESPAEDAAPKAPGLEPSSTPGPTLKLTTAHAGASGEEGSDADGTGGGEDDPPPRGGLRLVKS